MFGSGKNVFMIGWEYPPYNSGGLGVACEGLTRSLHAQGDQIAFTLPYAYPTNPSHLEFVNCEDPSWQSAGSGHAPFTAYGGGPLTDIIPAQTWQTLGRSQLEAQVGDYAAQVHQASRRQRLDVIHAHDWMAFPGAQKVRETTGQPLVAHIHSSEFDRIPDGSGSQYITQTEYEGLQAANQVIAVSFYTKQLLIKKYKVRPEKIQVVHNGIEPLDYTPSSEPEFAPHRPVVVFMGRLTAQKGAQFFLSLARQVLAKKPETLFVLAGDGDMYHELLISTARAGLSASVLFSGFVRNKQKEKLLNRANVFVMPSLSEPFGIVALEAAQRHTPVIVSKNAGVSEVMPSSIAMDFWDVDGMSGTIVELLKSPSQAQAIIHGQLKDLQHITWDKAARKVRNVYRRAFLGR